MDINSSFPRQKLSYKEKGDEWRKQCMDSCIAMVDLYGSNRRSSNVTKLRNYKLYNGEIDKADFEYVTNPYKLSGFSFPATLQPYDIVSPIFNLLLGEEAKRAFNPIPRVVNDSAISQSEEDRKEQAFRIFTELLQAQVQPEIDPETGEPIPPPTPEEVQERLNETMKDMREVKAGRLLAYYKKYNRLDHTFQRGMKDVLVAGEEFYNIRNIANEAIVRRINPLEIRFILAPNSEYIDDSDMIVEDRQMSLSQIIDDNYEDLSPEQIDTLEQEYGHAGYEEFRLSSSFVQSVNRSVANTYASDNTPHSIRVYDVTWKTKKKIGIWSYRDELGELQETIVDEGFIVDPLNTDESIVWFWINEYWSGRRIGEDMYLNIGPNENQFRGLDNISKCKSGYVGTVYNATNAQSVSLMDRLVPWVYLYLIIWYRTELLIAANQGKIALIDLSLVPDGWDIDKWLYYATAMKFGFVNSFNEGKKGQSTGKLAGNISTQNKTLDLETGNSIQHNISLLAFIEEKIHTVAGVTPQRMGAISTHELVGNTERSVVQSSHITEAWFAEHNFTKLRVMECLLDVAKTTLDGRSKKIRYMMDDLSVITESIDGSMIANAEYGLFVTDSTREHGIMEYIKGLAQSFIQAEKASIADIIDVVTSESIAEARSKLVAAEEKFHKRQMEMAQEQQQAAMMAAEENAALERERMDREDYNLEQDRQARIVVAEINSFSRQENQDVDGDGIADQIEIGTLALKQREAKSKERIEELKIQQTKVQNASQERIADKQAKLKEKEIQSKERIARMKPKPAKK